jgi:hypothetical protein
MPGIKIDRAVPLGTLHAPPESAKVMVRTRPVPVVNAAQWVNPERSETDANAGTPKPGAKVRVMVSPVARAPEADVVKPTVHDEVTSATDEPGAKVTAKVTGAGVMLTV